MITDYESFIAGVQLGRRLRLWDATRIVQPPLPPEVYIITEDDESIVTEFAPTGITTYFGGEWYPFSEYADRSESAAVISTGYMARWIREDATKPNFGYFQWVNDASIVQTAMFTDSQSAIDNSWFALEKLNNDGTITVLRRHYINYHIAFQIDDMWYSTAGLGNGMYRPDNAQAFHGKHDELIAYLSNNYYMITE